MKTARKIFALLMVAVMFAAFGTTAFAQTVNYSGTDATTDGKITVNNATVDKDYAIYKIFDATVSATGDIAYKTDKTSADLAKTVTWEEGTPPATQTAPVDGAAWFTIDAAGNVTQTAAQKTQLEADIASPKFAAWAKAFAGSPLLSVKATESTVEFDKVPYGYYFLSSTVGALITVDSTTPNVAIRDKNSTPPDWDNNDGKGKVVTVLTCTNTDPSHTHSSACYSKVEANAQYLDTPMDFDIGINAKRYDGAKKIFQYVIKDQMDPGMTFTSDPVVHIDKSQKSAGTDYTFAWLPAGSSRATATGFEINIPWTDNGKVDGNFLYNDCEIHITYSAMLDSTKVTDINLVDANKNKVGFDWYSDTDNPGTDPKDPLDPQGTNPQDETHTYSTSLNIQKLDGATKEALKGAEFQLTGTSLEKAIVLADTFTQSPSGTYWKLTNGTYTTDDPDTLRDDFNPAVHTGTDPTVPATYMYKFDRSKYESTTVKYAKSSTRSVQTNSSTAVNVKGTVNDAGELTFAGLGAGTYTLTETKAPAGYNAIAPMTLVVTFNDTTETFSVTVNGKAITGKTLDLDVENNKGAELPSTGGIGTTIFYILGSALLIGASVLLITRKRMSREG